MPLLPTKNSKLAHIAGDFHSITDALDYAAQGETGICIYGLNGEITASATYRTLRTQAITTALKLQYFGLKRGAHVAIIAETSVDYFSLFYGCQYAGLIPCPIPYTTYLGGKKEYLARIKYLAEVAGVSLICLPQNEPRRVYRRPFRLSYAAIAASSSMA